MPKSLAPVLSAIERAKQLIEAEKAPTVMTRSSITDLANRVRQSEGQYGAQRVERAADEIPNLEKLYQDQALMRAFTGDNAQALMTMKPSDFERYAAPLDANLSDRSLQKIADITGFHNNGGFSDVPYLNINKMQQGSTGLPYISGHEGRHRNRAMDAAGEQAGLVQLVPRSELREPFPRRSKEDYLEALYKEMQLTGNRVKPEAYYFLQLIKLVAETVFVDLVCRSTLDDSGNSSIPSVLRTTLSLVRRIPKIFITQRVC